MMAGPVDSTRYEFNDGLGVRWVARDPAHGAVEVLRLAPTLAARAAVEPALRARVAQLAGVPTPALAAVRQVERDGAEIRVVTDAVPGIRLSDLLAQLSSGAHLPYVGVVELAGAIVHAVADLHRLRGLVAHGAIMPAHVVLGTDGAATLTDGLFGPALESLQWNREKLWREFHVALPTAASVPRFDQRADVAQLGAVILAVALRRPLHADEYPRRVADLVFEATPEDEPGTPVLRAWLQHALQLHPRSLYPTAVEAEQAFAEVAGAVPGFRRTAGKALAPLLQPARMLIA